jgi:hypothetical protein
LHDSPSWTCWHGRSALGSFEGFRDYSDRGWTLGGTADQTALPIGALATLDTRDGTLTLDPVVC